MHGNAGWDGTAVGRAKNSARPWCGLAIWLVRAGFEPFRGRGFAADRYEWNERFGSIPRRWLAVGRGSKPARINPFAKPHRGRAEFFALPSLREILLL